jgi:hypothetical protein
MVESARLKYFYSKTLFTSRVFEKMEEDYIVSRNFPDGLFTRSGLKAINPLHTSVFLVRLKTLYNRVFLEKNI